MIGATAAYVRCTDDNPVIQKSLAGALSTVLIIGASRGIGLETVKLALKAGHSVRAMARSATAISLRDPKLEKLNGDALDQHTIEHALARVDAVIQTLGVSPTPELIFGGTRLFSVATRILVNAMEVSAG
jgi:NAD(P)-dependent dehydrogenase (short-subunit alcohol dehydrogenase family)